MLKAVRLNAKTYPVNPEERAELSRAGAELVCIEGKAGDEMIDAACDCDALLVVSSKVRAPVIRNLTRCRTIARLGSGTDNIDVDAATECGIVVSNVPDFCVNELAEHTMALLLACGRRLLYMTGEMRRGNWMARNHPSVHRIAGRTLGLIGFGRSGKAVASRARAFDMRILAWVRYADKYRSDALKYGVQLVGLDDLLSESDFVSIHVPLNGQTRHMITADSFLRMKKEAVLINTARGAIVDEEALLEALKSGCIAGAGLDVFEGIDVFGLPGRPVSHPLLKLDNVILTPHCSGSSVEAATASTTRGARNAADVLLGKWPAHIVNPEVKPPFELEK